MHHIGADEVERLELGSQGLRLQGLELALKHLIALSFKVKLSFVLRKLLVE